MTVQSKDSLRESFFEECEELLEAMHDGFDVMDSGSHDQETMNAIFRAVHSIKGGAGAFGLHDLVAFAHEFENALDVLRSGKIDLDPELLNLFRSSGDRLADLVSAAASDSEAPTGGEHLLSSLKKITSALGFDETEPDFSPVAIDIGDMMPGTAVSETRISFRPLPDLFRSGNEPLLLLRALKALPGAHVNVQAELGKLPSFDDLDPMQCMIAWNIAVSGDHDPSKIDDVFEFVEGMCEIEITSEVSETGTPADLEPLDFDNTSLPSLAEAISDPTETFAADTGNMAKEAEPSAPKSEGKKPGGTIRVDLEKVDKLINMVGELVIKEAMLSQSVGELDVPSDSNVLMGLDSLKQLAGEIQEGVMSIRAQPVKPMFQRMSRIVREAAAATGKRVKFVTNGDYTEVDKTVIERLVDPLTHMIRNAIDHGLETPDARTANGKAAEGTVTLSAAHRSGRVMIDISDDGAGINRQRVRQLAVEKGLIPESADLSPVEIDNLLFLPGFSSKEEVSELSGRGVGLDVVKNEIQGLGGRVIIHSRPGEGTTFSISLPLTLAVLEGMVIRIADQTMVVPISAIRETLQPSSAQLGTIGAKGRVLQNRNGLVPLIDLGSFFGLRPEPETLDGHVFLLVESDNHNVYALVVDEIQDQRQVVIKSLESNYQQIHGIAAATILGDGRIALIIDPDGIVDDLGHSGATDPANLLAG